MYPYRLGDLFNLFLGKITVFDIIPLNSGDYKCEYIWFTFEQACNFEPQTLVFFFTSFQPMIECVPLQPWLITTECRRRGRGKERIQIKEIQ